MRTDEVREHRQHLITQGAESTNKDLATGGDKQESGTPKGNRSLSTQFDGISTNDHSSGKKRRINEANSPISQLLTPLISNGTAHATLFGHSYNASHNNNGHNGVSPFGQVGGWNDLNGNNPQATLHNGNIFQSSNGGGLNSGTKGRKTSNRGNNRRGNTQRAAMNGGSLQHGGMGGGNAQHFGMDGANMQHVNMGSTNMYHSGMGAANMHHGGIGGDLANFDDGQAFENFGDGEDFNLGDDEVFDPFGGAGGFGHFGGGAGFGQ